MIFQLTTLMILTACGPTAPNDCETGDISPGTLSATFAGEDWTADGVIWNESGNSVQINTNMTNGYRLSIVLQQTENDERPANLTEMTGPWEFDLGENGGGWVTAYPQTGSSTSSRNGGSGHFTLIELADDLTGCFEFSTGELSMTNGQMIALPLGN